MTRRGGKDRTAAGRRDTPAAPFDASRRPSGTWIAAVLLIVISALWIALSQTVFFVGPSEWDDNVYCDLAAVPQPMESVAARFFHAWSLRIFNLVIETRRTAGALYPAMLTIGLGWVGFFLGRRIAGNACGLVAAVLMPFHPALLKYLTVPYADTAMVLWGGLAVLCALTATDASSSRRQMLATLAAGACVLFSVQSKETGIATLLPVILALWSCKRRFQLAGVCIVGAFAGLLLLSTLDWLFIGDFLWHWKWSTYFPERAGGGGGSSTARMGQHYVQVLLTTEFLAFTLLGVAGAAAGYRKQLTVRCVTLWAFSGMVFSSLVSCRYHGVHALDRYCVIMGAPLTVLSAYWIILVWRRPVGGEHENRRRSLVALAVALLFTLGIAMYGLLNELTGHGDKSIVRFTFFMMPPALLVLFLTPWLGCSRWAPRVTLVLMVAAADMLSTNMTLRYRDYKRNQLSPWVELTEALDAAGANLVKWELPYKPYAEFRIERRCRTLSKRPAREFNVRKVESLSEVKPTEWVFTSPKAGRALQQAGWVPVVQGRQEGVGFVVYRPPP